MAQIIPPLTTLPVDSSAAPSVEDIQDRLPSICVDYLSHDWSEEDVWASWRNMTRHKHEIANGVRLENASWRTWQKQRNKLKTISPETLNWLKDSDVTWLYGPLHTANVEPVRPLKVATADERLGIDRPVNYRPADGPKKPILKHRTLSEMLTIPMPASPILESTSRDDDDDVESLDGAPERPVPHRTKSDSNIFRNRNRRKSPPRNANSLSATPAKNTQMADLPPVSAGPSTSGKRHISFNTFVEQCVAVDEQDFNPLMEEDSDDDMLEMKSSASGSSSAKSSISSMFGSNSEHMTIAKIAPTLLKVNGTYAANPSAPQMVYAPPPEYISPSYGGHSGTDYDFPPSAMQQNQLQVHQAQGIPAASGRGAGSVSPQWRSGGDHDDDYGTGYEYFQGPDFASGDAQLSTSPSTSTSRAIPAGGTHRQAAATPPEPASASSSSTSSLGGVVSTTPPTRGILKVRPPGVVAPEEQVSPPVSEFNYNPSVATGIGGMRTVGGYEYPMPPANPSNGATGGGGAGGDQETRGRSTSRGSSAFDRSSSRGTSTSSASSISPGSGSGTTTRAMQLDASASSRGRQQVVSAAAASRYNQSHGTTSPSTATTTSSTSPPSSATLQTPKHDPTAANTASNSNSVVDRNANGGASHGQAQAQGSLKGPVDIVPNSTGPNSNQGASDDQDDKMDVDEVYHPERSNTPTPHSSPQISLRPLKDTSPSSLPHTSTSAPAPKRPSRPSSSSSSTSSTPATATASASATATANSSRRTSNGTVTAGSGDDTPHHRGNMDPTTTPPSDLPTADPPTRSGKGNKATIAHVSTNAQPTMSLPNNTAWSSSGTDSDSLMSLDDDSQSYSRSDQLDRPTESSGIGEESIMGRAANIASTAKDLLGALWYGANEDGEQVKDKKYSQPGGVAGAAAAAAASAATGNHAGAPVFGAVRRTVSAGSQGSASSAGSGSGHAGPILNGRDGPPGSNGNADAHTAHTSGASKLGGWFGTTGPVKGHAQGQGQGQGQAQQPGSQSQPWHMRGLSR